MLSKKLLIGALVATMSVSSFAHFQMIYTADLIFLGNLLYHLN